MIENKIYENFISGLYEGKGFGSILRRERAFGVSAAQLKAALILLEDKGKIYYANGKYYQKRPNKPVIEENPIKLIGKIRTNERGFGFLCVEGDKDYFVAPENLGDCLNGDTVEGVTVRGRGTNDSARVVKVIKRGFTSLVGTYFTEGAFSYVRPDDKGYLCDIFIIYDQTGGAEVGDKVYIEIERFPKNRCPEGKVISIIGKSFLLETEEEALVYKFNLHKDFSPESKAAAASIKKEIADNEVIDRLNLENEIIFTIDGDTAKDFDDAVSLKTNESGNYILGVHIADVSAYVTERSALDNDAFERGTSTYFPDRVIPMLPFELSNGICSLVEGERRLTVSVFCEIDGSGNVLDAQFFKSYIKSKKRLTYREVDRLFEGDKEVEERLSTVKDTLFKMKDLAKILENRRAVEGYINLDVKEADLNITNGSVQIGIHEATAATKLIEQFMITANEAVASFLFYQELPCVYRIHETPSAEKLKILQDFVDALGIKFFFRRDGVRPKDFQKLLSAVEGKPYSSVVNKVVLRSMQKAKYSPQNEGHFGLASKCYCHFTSPIRRYPDLLVHRALKAALDGEIMQKIDLYEDFFVSAAERSSERERNSEEAERAVDDLFKAKYLEDRIGEEAEGVISGVKESGVFVELDNTCEGFVPIELFPRGSYSFEKDKFSLKSSKFDFSIGKKVSVFIDGVDLGERKAQFSFADLGECRIKSNRKNKK
ncbi:MAG: ribonuclease R [Clostridia bacterium]|nr:ribonuclease R [Clostridia bacterium]